MFLCTFNLFSQLSSVHVVFSLVLRICREEGCGQKNTWIDEVDEFGAGLRVHTECAVGHKMTWESSEFYNKVQFSQRVWVCKYLISGFYWWRLVTVLLVIQYIFGVHLVSSSYPSEPPILWICTLSFCSIILVFMLQKILVPVYLEFYVTVPQQWQRKFFCYFLKGRTSRIDVELSTAILLSGIPIESTQSFLSLVNIATNHQTTSSRFIYLFIFYTVRTNVWLLGNFIQNKN